MKYLRIFLSILILTSLVLTFSVGISKIKAEKPLYEKESSFSGILNLWHIDTFDGGTGSRKQFLLDTARSFEKNNSGTLICVTTHTEDSIKDNFNKGIFPDMISFSSGVLVEKVKELNISKTFRGGEVGGKLYAIPWCVGGYFLIAKDNLEFLPDNQYESILVSKGNYNLINLSRYLENITANEYQVKNSKDAISTFLLSRCGYMLGTQRDIVRLYNRNVTFKTKFLGEFSDLVQYISVLADSEDRINASNQFIEHLTSENVQKKLKKISMFSAFYNVETDIEGLRELSNPRKFLTISAFMDKHKILEVEENLLKAEKGDENAKIKIKKVLI